MSFEMKVDANKQEETTPETKQENITFQKIAKLQASDISVAFDYQQLTFAKHESGTCLFKTNHGAS